MTKKIETTETDNVKDATAVKSTPVPVNPYAMFMTEVDMEVSGVWLDYGSFRVKIARSGGKNTMYSKIFAQVAGKYKNVSVKALGREKVDALYAKVYARAVIKAWEVKDEHDDWKSGLHILGADGTVSIKPMNVDNIIAVLTSLPDLFSDIMSQSGEIATFQKEEEEDITGN